MIRLMNSTMMPQEGIYRLLKVEESQIKGLFNFYRKIGHEVQSYIGYEQTAKYMSNVLDYEVPVNRVETTLESGDVLIICKLPYRVPNPNDKGKEVKEEFEWFVAEYKKLWGDRHVRD